ncbi:hypothetical protein C1E23_03715, partial [Pseudoalteromonas phenolica]
CAAQVKYNNCAQFYRHIKLDENIAKYYENEVKVLQKEGEAKLSKLPEAQQEELAQWYKEQHKSVPWMHSSEWVYKFWGSIMCWPVK